MSKLLDAQPHFVRFVCKYHVTSRGSEKEKYVLSHYFTVLYIISMEYFFFRRCLKPNHQKQANLFQPELVLAQLRYTGILETVRIRRQGYATRLLHDVFVDR